MGNKKDLPGTSGRRGALPEGPFDLAIVGGGINGAAIARDAVLRGLTVCLFEKDDIAQGTSSRTSKMVHGGIRYLEHLQLGLVFESLRERWLQLRLAPHLVAPQAFVIPVYDRARRGPFWIRLGLYLYDLLAIGRRPGKARYLAPPEVLERVPGLSGAGLAGGGLYFDGVMDDARLCLANVLDAREAARPGQLHFRTHAEVVSIKPTSPARLEVHDRILGRSFRLLAHRVVRAVGPWSDRNPADPPLLVPSKGVHLVLPPLTPSVAGAHGLLLTHSRDGRVFFVIPWQGKTLVGTTETPFRGSPDRLRVEPEEVEYLLEELRRLFPERRFAAADVLATFAGVRPLARSSMPWSSPGRVSRKHRIIETAAGILTVVGGKYTTYRAVAREVLNRLAPGKRAQTHRRPLHGGEAGNWESYQAGPGRPWIERFGAEPVQRLFHRYGSRLAEVLQLADEDPDLRERLDPAHPELRAEAVHGVLREEVRYPEDFICRRTDMRFQKGNGRAAYDEVEAIIRKHAEPLNAAPPDLAAARERFHEDLAWEDRLRQGPAVAAK